MIIIDYNWFSEDSIVQKKIGIVKTNVYINIKNNTIVRQQHLYNDRFNVIYFSKSISKINNIDNYQDNYIDKIYCILSSHTWNVSCKF